MIEKRISLKIETGDAKRQLQDIKDSLAGIDKNMPSSKSKPFEGVANSSKTARKALIDYTGSLSNANRIVIQSSNYATLAEKAALAQDTALRKLNKVYDEGRIDLVAYNAALAETNKRNAYAVGELSRTTDASGRSTASFKVMRGSLAGLSYQFQDMAVQAQMGTSWFTIIGQQGPQIASYFGALGAVLGVVVAISAAVGGVLYKSIKAANGESENLKKTMQSLGKVIKQNSEGVYEFSDSIVNLTKVSNSASNIKIALALYDAKNSIKRSSEEIGKSIKSVGSNFGNLFNFFRGGYLDDIRKVQGASLDLSKVLDGTIKPSTINAGYDLSESMNRLRNLTSDVADQFGLTKKQATDFVSSLSGIGSSSTTKDFNKLQDSINGVFNSLNVADLTKEQEKFLRLASSISEAAQNGATAAKIVDKLTKSVDGPIVAFSRPFDEASISSIKLTESVSKLTNQNDIFLTSEQKKSNVLASTRSLMSSINKEYDRLNDLQIKNTDISSNDALSAAKKNTLQIIADEISQYDNYADRLKVISNLKKEGISLTDNQVESIKNLANQQNFVYEKQLSYNNSLKDNAKTLSEIYDQGAQDYVKSVGTMNDGLQGLVTSTFKSMSDAIVSWAETGKLNFTDFVNSAISDLLRLMVQQQVAGLAASFIGGSSAGSSYFNTSTTATGSFAKGGAIERFSTGGITGMANTIQSTPKRFANGSGMLGEAGQAEAIVPLTRTSGGDLGIKSVGGSSSPVINFNVTNQAGVESKSTQSQNADGSFDINIINSLVSKSIASGHADKAITQRFNITKRGK